MQKNKIQQQEILLSIIIPVYNVERYIRECLDSVLMNNINERIEIVLVNDGSKDNSLSICNEYSIKYQNVKLINQQNQGLSEARNEGIRNACGKYLLFLDSDDFLEQDTLHKILKDLKSAEKDFFIGRSVKNIQKSKELSQVDYEIVNNQNPQEAFLRLNSINGFWFAAWLIIINRQFLLKNNLFFKKGILHEDELWVPSVFIHANSVGFLNYGFYGYRLNREGSIVSEKNIKREFDKLIVADELAKYYGISKISDEIISQRRAAIAFGIVAKLITFKDHKDFNKLTNCVRDHIEMLNYNKYRVLFYIYKLIGIKMLSKFLNKKW